MIALTVPSLIRLAAGNGLDTVPLSSDNVGELRNYVWSPRSNLAPDWCPNQVRQRDQPGIPGVNDLSNDIRLSPEISSDSSARTLGVNPGVFLSGERINGQSALSYLVPGVLYHGDERYFFILSLINSL